MAFKSGQLKKLPVNDGEMKRVSLGLLSGEVRVRVRVRLGLG